ncbi:MAG: DUF6132 family protein [Cryomorphaceae bacterium]|nr:DUF6132 family protein [Cryomorphaceae bacterium]
MKVLKWLHRNKITLVGILLGLTGGYLYYYFIGCSSGSCAITSRPLNSSLYGAIMGGLFFSLFERKK